MRNEKAEMHTKEEENRAKSFFSRLQKRLSDIGTKVNPTRRNVDGHGTNGEEHRAKHDTFFSRFLKQLGEPLSQLIQSRSNENEDKPTADHAQNEANDQAFFTRFQKRIKEFLAQVKRSRTDDGQNSSKGARTNVNRRAFFVIVRKEFTDYVTSWRINILLFIIALTCLGSLYTAASSLQDALQDAEQLEAISNDAAVFLKIFTVSDGTLPSFLTFITFLGPLLGIALGFDAINSERNRGTLSRLMAQPIPRDYVLNAKFVAALLVNVLLFFALGALVTGISMIVIGIPPTWEEIWRIVLFLIVAIAYVAFWLNLGILFSVRFRQAATSALASIAVWLFFTVFYQMIVGVVQKGMAPTGENAADIISYQNFILNISRLSPNFLFTESTATLLTPSVRTLGPITVEQATGAIAAPLPLSQSIMLIWPQLTGLIAATMLVFLASYLLFMRQEIRSK